MGAVLTAPAYDAVRGVIEPPDPGAPVGVAAGAADELPVGGAPLGVATRVPSGVLTSIRDPSSVSAPTAQSGRLAYQK